MSSSIGGTESRKGNTSEGGGRNNLNEGANSTHDSVNSEQLLDLDAQPSEMQRHIQEGTSRKGASLRIPLSSCLEQFPTISTAAARRVKRVWSRRTAFLAAVPTSSTQLGDIKCRQCGLWDITRICRLHPAPYFFSSFSRLSPARPLRSDDAKSAPLLPALVSSSCSWLLLS